MIRAQNFVFSVLKIWNTCFFKKGEYVLYLFKCGSVCATCVICQVVNLLYLLGIHYSKIPHSFKITSRQWLGSQLKISNKMNIYVLLQYVLYVVLTLAIFLDYRMYIIDMQASPWWRTGTVGHKGPGAAGEATWFNLEASQVH